MEVETASNDSQKVEALRPSCRSICWKGSSDETIFNGKNTFYFQNPKLSPSRHHSVLFQVPLPCNYSLPMPKICYQNQDLWNQENVKAPFSIESKFEAMDDFNRKQLKSRWKVIEESLLQPISSSYDLETAIKTYNNRYRDIWNFSGLHQLFQDHYDGKECAFFFEKLLPHIINMALRLPQLIPSPIPLLKQGMNKSISLSQEQCCSLLANAFLCTFPRRNTIKRDAEYSNYPDINFNRLFGPTELNVFEKMKCIINYFRRTWVKMPLGVVTFSRRSLRSIYNWESSGELLSNIKWQVTEGKIEEASGMTQVDFANKLIGGGVLSRGCVQEEIRFCISPEMIVARLFTECLGDKEALVIIGCEQFSSYEGYSGSFKFKDDFEDKTPYDSFRRRKTTVVAIDALKYKTNSEQFREEIVRRELNKAYIGFDFENDLGKSPIASGCWGCGAFNGIIMKSALIQFMAAAAVNRNFVFYTNGDEKSKDEIADIFELLSKKQVSVGFLFQTINHFYLDENVADTTRLIPFIKKEVSKYKVSRHDLIPNTTPEFRRHSLLEFMNLSGRTSTSKETTSKSDQDKVQKETTPGKKTKPRKSHEESFNELDQTFGIDEKPTRKEKNKDEETDADSIIDMSFL